MSEKYICVNTNCKIHVALTFRVPGLVPDMPESRTSAHQAEALVTWHACHCISSLVQPAMKKKMNWTKITLNIDFQEMVGVK